MKPDGAVCLQDLSELLPRFHIATHIVTICSEPHTLHMERDSTMVSEVCVCVCVCACACACACACVCVCVHLESLISSHIYEWRVHLLY